MRSALALILVVGAAAQVTPPAAEPVEIRGAILEGGTNLPVADAEVMVSAPEGFRQKEIANTTTDSQGRFRVALEKTGEYLVRAEKAGYTYDGRNLARHQPSNQYWAKLDKYHPSAEARLTLVRAGALTGRVIDADTGKPIANLVVYPIAIQYDNGEPTQVGGKRSVTDSDGLFLTTGLEPGKYLVAIRPQTLGREQISERFSEEDRKVVDRDYQRSYWPGGGGFDAALPIPVLPAGSANVGTIKARKGPFYRIHLSIPADGCTPGESVQIFTEMLRFIDSGGSGAGECGKQYLLRNFEPGPYSFYVLSGKTQEDRKRVVLPVDVTDKNLDLSIPLARGIDIDGRIVAAEGASQPPLKDIKIRMEVTGNIQFTDERTPATPDAEGKFRLVNRPLARVRVSVSDLPPNFDVKEIRYNGAAIVDNIVALNANAPVQSLEVVVDDKPGLIAGAVADGDKPVNQAHVVLVKWPVSREDIFLSARTTEGDEAGKFQFAGLAPGEYRILAVAPEAVDRLDEPHVLERLLNGAERVTVSPGGRDSLSLKVKDPSR